MQDSDMNEDFFFFFLNNYGSYMDLTFWLFLVSGYYLENGSKKAKMEAGKQVRKPT